MIRILSTLVLAALAASPSFATAVTSSTTPPPPNPGIGAQTNYDSKMSDTTMSGSNSLRAAMKAVGRCGIATRSILYAIGSPASSSAHFTAGVSAPVTTVCPNVQPVVDRRTLSPSITRMWAWGNPVSPHDDTRGLGQAAMAARPLSWRMAVRVVRCPTG